MDAADVVAQLQAVLPTRTAFFTDETAVTSITRSGTTVTVNTAVESGVSSGQIVVVNGAIVPIDIGTLTRSGIVGTLVTDSDHDLTNAIAPTITIDGATEGEFNGTFARINVDNRTTIRFTMADSGATTATGSPLLLNGESPFRQYNGIHEITNKLSLAFEYEDALSGLNNPVGTITVQTNPRVSGAATLERAIEAYTAKPAGDLWMFVVLDDVVASKDRSVDSDAVDNQQRGDEFRQQIVMGFTLYVMFPTADQIAGRSSRDVAQGLLQPICQAVLFKQFPTGLFASTHGAAQFVSHGAVQYDSAFYLHQFLFQQTVDLTFEDTVGPDVDVAWRDTSMTIQPDLGGTGEMTADFSMDDDPL